MNISDRILITGAGGVLGTALAKVLNQEGFNNLTLLVSNQCDLMDFEQTKRFFQEAQPDYVFHLAGRVTGIMGNLKNKGLSYYNNIVINTNTVEASKLANVKKIIAMGTVAAYPDCHGDTVYKEDMIWNGYPHHSEDSYGLAKRSMLGQLIAYKESYNLDYSFVISTNLFGPNDRFDTKFGHVIPSLVAKFHEAKQTGGRVNVWGDGSSVRDFVYSDDAAFALLQIAHSFTGPINLATGITHSIREVVECLSRTSGVSFERVDWDTSMPKGQLLRSYDVSKLEALDCKIKHDLQTGIDLTFKWYEENVNTARK